MEVADLAKQKTKNISSEERFVATAKGVTLLKPGGNKSSANAKKKAGTSKGGK